MQWRRETKSQIFVCLTCNDIYRIPTEFYRAGRIDGVFATGLPVAKERTEIFKIHLRKRGKEEFFDDLDFSEIAKASESFTGAEIELAVMEAIFVAFNDGKAPITTELLLDACENIVPQATRNKEEMDAMTAWIEERAMPVSSFMKRKKKERGGGKVRRLSFKGSEE